MDLRFTISADIPSFANSSAASTQKPTPMECATRVISVPARCILAYGFDQVIISLTKYDILKFYIFKT